MGSKRVTGRIMADQVQYLTKEPPAWQLGEHKAPCNGQSTCTDNVGKMIVFHEKKKKITTAQFRQAAAPHKPECNGLTPAEFLRGLIHFGVTKYKFYAGATPSDVLKATDRGIVLVGVGYSGYPTVAECEVGGKTDVGFKGPHATSGWGRRLQNGLWYYWSRDPDHHFDGTDANGRPSPRYDKFETKYLTRAMKAIIGNGNPGRPKWGTTFMIAREAA